ncbi:MAG: cytochrome b/b6 domain-containing protein, partial [Proteobacteria bacterium]|nr:cytochrome b/b6 domain-containing protein [Pseudomonadota bacterium]
MKEAMNNLNERKPLGLRIWHWGSGLTLLLILATVLLRKTFLSSRKMAEVISGELTKGGVQ